MYKDHFGLAELPFMITPNPRYLFLSSGHQEALAHLLFGLQGEGGFILLTGEVGTGKTMVCRTVLEKAPAGCDVAFILHSQVTPVELLASLCDELEIAYPADSSGTKPFVDALHAHLLDAHGRGRNTVLIIEEAQNLTNEALEQVRLLTNLETAERKLLQVILVGQPELRESLALKELRQVSQRITGRYHLEPLSGTEVCEYVRHRLKVAGGRADLFSKAALRRLASTSKGIPRLINVIADRSLLGAFVEGQQRVDARTVRRAAEEVQGRGSSPVRLAWLWAGVAVAVVALVVAAGIRVKTTTRQPSPELSQGARMDTLWWFQGYEDHSQGPPARYRGAVKSEAPAQVSGEARSFREALPKGTQPGGGNAVILREEVASIPPVPEEPVRAEGAP